MPETANITRPTGQNKGATRCVCPRCGAALEFTLGVAPHQQQQWRPQEPQEPPRPQQWRQQQPARQYHASPQPWTPQRARDFVLPIGKHRGKTLDEVYRQHPDYLRWLAENVGRGVGRAAQNYLALCTQQPERN
jgi:hypothetical protein